MGAKAPLALEVEWRACLIRVLELLKHPLSQHELREGLGLTAETPDDKKWRCK
jgi:hypothetical protein